MTKWTGTKGTIQQCFIIYEKHKIYLHYQALNKTKWTGTKH